MKIKRFFFAASGLMMLAFALYVAAPVVRSKLAGSKPSPILIPASGPQKSPTAPPTPKPVSQIRKENPAASTAAQSAQPETVPAIVAPDPQETGAAPQPDPPPVPVDPPPVQMRQLYGDTPTIAFKVRVLAGQQVHFDNALFTWIRISSDFPLMVRIGKCESTETIDITCDISPNLSIDIQDARIGSADPTPNVVRITAARDAP